MAAPNLAGMVLEGKYRLTQLLGEGGMGFVFAAEHVALRRPLAVKFLRPELASDPTALARLRQEAIASSSIGSPHIVEVLDLGTAPGGAPFIVMEFLRGRPLSALLAEQPVLPVQRIANILCQVLAALGAAHVQGIIHRDLKPENVFLAESRGGDFVKLLDFGISKVRTELSAGSNLTQTGAVLGTPRFMAPEQAAGRRDVDHRVDLWATGVVLYRALTGRYPFDAENYNALLAAVLMADPVPLRRLRPDLDPGLETVIARALARDPAARYSSADELRAALAPYAQTRPSAGPAYAPSFAPAAHAGAYTPYTPHAPAPSGPTPGTPSPYPPAAAATPYPQATGAAAPYPPAAGPATPYPQTPQTPWPGGTPHGVGLPATMIAKAPRGRGTWIVVAIVAALVVGGAGTWLIVAPPWADDDVAAATPAPAAAAARRGAPARKPAASKPPKPARRATTGAPEAEAGPETEAEPEPEAAASPDESEPTSGDDEIDAQVEAILAQMRGGEIDDDDVDAQRTIYVEIQTEISCRTTQWAMQAEDQLENPQAMMRESMRIYYEVMRKYDMNPLQYAKLAQRFAMDEEAMGELSTRMMACMTELDEAGALDDGGDPRE